MKMKTRIRSLKWHIKMRDASYGLFLYNAAGVGVVWFDRQAGTTAKQKPNSIRNRWDGHLLTRNYRTGHMKSIFCAEINRHRFEKTHAASSSLFNTNIAQKCIANAVEI
jgi:hypothetical protein